jgi:hypothetical protein
MFYFQNEKLQTEKHETCGSYAKGFLSSHSQHKDWRCCPRVLHKAYVYSWIEQIVSIAFLTLQLYMHCRLKYAGMTSREGLANHFGLAWQGPEPGQGQGPQALLALMLWRCGCVFVLMC